MARPILATAAAFVMLMLTATLAAAAPVPAVIDVTAEFAQPGVFVAVSDALCESGTTTDVATASTAGPVTTFDDLKTFTCQDGSGTFTLHIVARVIGCAATDSGTWKVVGGTGDYESLKGQGQLTGTYFGGTSSCDAVGIVDHLTGKLKL
jgi:Na+/melibiose symporter-like transporter